MATTEQLPASTTPDSSNAHDFSRPASFYRMVNRLEGEQNVTPPIEDLGVTTTPDIEDSIMFNQLQSEHSAVIDSAESAVSMAESRNGLSSAQAEAMREFAQTKSAETEAMTEKLTEARDRALDMGNTALTFAQGVDAIAYRYVKAKALKVNTYTEEKYLDVVESIQESRENRRDARAERRKARKLAKSQRREARAEWRAEKRESLNDKTIGRARRLGKRAIDISDSVYTAGLERTDQYAANERRASKANRDALALQAKKIDQITHNFNTIDTDIQPDSTKAMLSNDITGALDRFTSDETNGYISGEFTSPFRDGETFKVFYEEMEGGQLLPQLMMKEAGKDWAKANVLLPNGKNAAATSSTMPAELKSQMDLPSEYGDTVSMTDWDFMDLVKQLDYSKPEPVVSEFRKKREAIIAAKKQAAKNAAAKITSSTGPRVYTNAEGVKVTDTRAVRVGGFFS